jgi:hypothetical protein
MAHSDDNALAAELINVRPSHFRAAASVRKVIE